MLITLDGVSGAGKSTQCDILCKMLNLPAPKFIASMVAHEIISDLIDAHSRYSKLFATLQAIHSLPKKAIVEDYFFNLTHGFKSEPADKRAELIRFFQQAITLNKPEPTLSIYLKVSREVAIPRRLERSTGPVTGLQLSSEFHREDRLEWTYFHQLADMLPYFHVVDGALPIEQVTQKILNLLNHATG